MTITQTVEIPNDRRVFFEFLAPQEIPAGKTKIEMKLTPFTEKEKSRKFNTEAANDPATPHTDALLNIVSRMSSDINIDEIRAERLKKHIK